MSDKPQPQNQFGPNFWILVAIGNLMVCAIVAFLLWWEYRAALPLWFHAITWVVLAASTAPVTYLCYLEYRKAGGTLGARTGRRPDLGSHTRRGQ